MRPIIGRVIARRAPPEVVDDLVQDTLERVLLARDRLAPESLVAYAIVVARSRVVSEWRTRERQRRLEPSMADMRQPDQPEPAVLEAEERVAVRSALERLPARDRDALLRHEVGGVDLAELALEAGTTPGALATRLSRARARLRVEYVLVARRARLPTDECHPILVALSAGDVRRQRRLGAAAHLLDCETCASIAGAVVERRRVTAALAGIGAMVAGAWHWLRRHPIESTAGGVTAAVIVAAGAYAVLRDPSTAEPSAPVEPPATTAAPIGRPAGCQQLRLAGQPVGPITTDALGSRVAEQIEASSVPVASVPADEGFWVDCGGLRLWVFLTGANESPPTVTEGSTVSFTGTLTGHGPEFAIAQGLSPEEGAAELAGSGVHIEVPQDAVSQP